jgi:hypothetical protein
MANDEIPNAGDDYVLEFPSARKVSAEDHLLKPEYDRVEKIYLKVSDTELLNRQATLGRYEQRGSANLGTEEDLKLEIRRRKLERKA